MMRTEKKVWSIYKDSTVIASPTPLLRNRKLHGRGNSKESQGSSRYKW